MNYFQKLVKDARRGFRSKVEGAQLMYSIFGDTLDEVDFQMWLVDALKLKDRNELIMFLSYSAEESSAITPRGRKLLSISERESAYNFWKINSEISIHRSNGRHFIKISKENISTQVSDIQDSNISTVETKRDYKLEAYKRITTKSYKILHKDFQKLYNPTISHGSFINLKPFNINIKTGRKRN